MPPAVPFINGKRFVIGKLPECISKNNIIVSSTNNGAVENIVSELPKRSSIHDEYLKDIEYFGSDEQNWGIFSIQGGSRSNIAKIVDKLEEIVNSFDKIDIDIDEQIKSVFLIKTEEIKEKRDEITKIVDNLKTKEDEIQIEKLEKDISNFDFYTNYLIEIK